MDKVALPIDFNKQIFLVFVTGYGKATQLITREVFNVDKTFIIYNTEKVNTLGNNYLALGI